MAERRQIEDPHIGRQDKLYRVVITDETDGNTEVFNKTVCGLMMLGETGDKMCEIVLNESLVSIAALLDSSTKAKHAVRLATLINTMRKEDTAEMATEFEDMLSELMGGTEGGIQ